MNKKTITLAVSLFVVIIVGMFIYAGIKQQELRDKSVSPVATTTVPEEIPYSYIDRIEAKHFYIDGVHTIVGEIEMPTPCDLLETSGEVRESYPEQIVVDFTVINTAEMCTQVITPARFQYSVKASPDATFSARFMGRNIELNLVPAGEGETPEDFELYQKG